MKFQNKNTRSSFLYRPKNDDGMWRLNRYQLLQKLTPPPAASSHSNRIHFSFRWHLLIWRRILNFYRRTSLDGGSSTRPFSFFLLTYDVSVLLFIFSYPMPRQISARIKVDVRKWQMQGWCWSRSSFAKNSMREDEGTESHTWCQTLIIKYAAFRLFLAAKFRNLW